MFYFLKISIFNQISGFIFKINFPLLYFLADAVVPKILFQLCSGPMAPTQHLETQQALVKQFAEILEFVLKFDEHKVSL